MEKGSDGLREQLLARLPKSENVAAYRESTEALLAKHERAVFWERVTGRTVTWLGLAVFMFANSTWARPRLDSNGTALLDALAVVLFFTGALNLLGYSINRSKVDLLKEVKQVQLQVLELQASLKKDVDR
jgi:type VI protein secretion system component VasF